MIQLCRGEMNVTYLMTHRISYLCSLFTHFVLRFEFILYVYSCWHITMWCCPRSIYCILHTIRIPRGSARVCAIHRCTRACVAILTGYVT